MSSCRSRKSTPMVDSTLQGKSPAQRRCVRHVFPTAESPITSTLKVRQRLHSDEPPLPSEPENSSEDSMCARSAGPTGARAAWAPGEAQVCGQSVWRLLGGTHNFLEVLGDTSPSRCSPMPPHGVIGGGEPVCGVSFHSEALIALLPRRPRQCNPVLPPSGGFTSVIYLKFVPNPGNRIQALLWLLDVLSSSASSVAPPPHPPQLPTDLSEIRSTQLAPPPVTPGGVNASVYGYSWRHAARYDSASSGQSPSTAPRRHSRTSVQI
ncbi:hypothetical protein EYF80_062172 [Liparis tanakae]|uniref:Uncharacterized protein n=1 Tax=Liparis tanakae TaxID=230148 RepID=A0A4Z2EGB1_9TELE|nr:hypothetical protein EYF80_062172 [Liparis tanakae]